MHSTRHRTKLHKQKEKMNTEPDELKMQKRFPCAVPRKSLAGPFRVINGYPVVLGNVQATTSGFGEGKTQKKTTRNYR